MYLFKTSGSTFQSVIKNQKHAFINLPSKLKPGDLILVSKNKADCVDGEKQIQYTMRYEGARTANDSEISILWPGNSGRWNWIIDCNDTKALSAPFDLEEVIGQVQYLHYRNVQTFCPIRPEDADKLLKLIDGNLTQSNIDPFFDEEEEPAFSEGSQKKVYVNQYERDSKARAACIKHHGESCAICGFDFEVTYGKIGKGYIQVHHLKPLGEIGKEYATDPINDLIPVCPNCHAMIHGKRPARDIEEIRRTLID
jgi:hypothetical protein